MEFCCNNCSDLLWQKYFMQWRTHHYITSYSFPALRCFAQWKLLTQKLILKEWTTKIVRKSRKQNLMSSILLKNVRKTKKITWATVWERILYWTNQYIIKYFYFIFAQILGGPMPTYSNWKGRLRTPRRLVPIKCPT